jgi:L-threonylcarbamoyladenylate synthase
MQTIIVSIDAQNPDLRQLMSAAELLRAGEIVAFPTETVYGLGADALNRSAVAKIFAAKGRPPDNPLIVHIYEMDQLKDLVEYIPPMVDRLCRVFWPGPLTILFKKKSIIPDIVTASLSTVAIRMPKHPVARALLQVSGLPIAAPSANLSGKPSPTNAGHVITDFDGQIPLILDGGSTEVGLESTVIDVEHDPPLILRPGGITLEDLRPYLPQIRPFNPHQDGKMEQSPPTPGLKYRHYSPQARLVLYVGSIPWMATQIKTATQDALKSGKKVGILRLTAANSYLAYENSAKIISLGESSSIGGSIYQKIARGLFDALREFDQSQCDLILAESVGEDAEGMAIMNRLRKAASEIITE